MAEVRVGTSGWRYPHWRHGAFYPEGLVQRRELEHLAGLLDTVEVNGSFYSLQRPGSWRAWRAAVPDGFCFAVKGGRYLTHLKRLRDVEVPLANFLASGVLALGPTLGPVLWQLPERLTFDPAVLDAFLALLPRTSGEAARLAARHDDKLPADRAVTAAEDDRPLRHAVEPRHPSFLEPDAVALLREHRVATVMAETAGRWPMATAVTSDLVYVRLHGHDRLYAGRYPDDVLDTWAERCRRWRDDGHDVVVYLDNDGGAHAPHDALRLRDRLA